MVHQFHKEELLYKILILDYLMEFPVICKPKDLENQNKVT